MRTTKPEPIAIVGIGCRFPGAEGPEAFWRLLAEGREAIRPVPPDRWNGETLHHDNPVAAPGTIRTRLGGFLDRIDLFDAGFFGISPREAQAIDPQQRLLLETGFEALEDGGLDPARLRGEKVGVFIGIAAYDYAEIQHAPENRHLIGPHTNTGLALSIAANRISYIFDFRGPSIAVDTACSSSLVAVHLAVQSLRSRESTLALAGGVNAILKPEATIGFSRAAMLSPDGRCKTFDAGANGYARGEGCGIIVLKRLARAIADGDHIYALIRGSAVNQDGSTSGISVPSQAAQEAALRDALAQAGFEPAEIQYVEAHGTGTPVGDPIEARALGRVLGQGRDPAAPCRLGSVKTNIGHLESAAGIAGLIKAALAIERRLVPASLNFVTPNPEIPFTDLKLRVTALAEPWPEPGRTARAGINSFGFGGTNAHVVIEEAPAENPRPQQKDDGPWLLPLSAATLPALEQSLLAYAGHLEGLGSEGEIAALCAWAAVRRPHQAWRATVLGRNAEELAASLHRLQPAAFAADAGSSDAIPARTGPASTGPVFVYSGMGPQWWGMGRELLAKEPAVRQALEECDAAYRRLSGWSLLSAFRSPEAETAMERTEIAQPCNFALQVALTRLWRSWGITPGAILGHSAGEVAAAYAAGVLTLDEAAAVAHHRSRLQSRTAGLGRMAACGLSETEAVSRLAPYEGRLSLAAVNGPGAVTLSGDADALADLVATLEREGRFARLLRVDVPYHSHHMDPLEAELRASLATLDPATPRVPFYSTVTGAAAGIGDYGADYWWRNVRQPVLFAKAVQEIAARHHDTFLEIGPHPVLGSAILEGLSNGGRPFAALASLRRETGERASLLASLGRLYERGFAIDWRGVYPGPHPFVRLPGHSWDRQSYWHESSASRAARLAAPAHPLLGRREDGPGAEWQSRLDPRRIPALADHRVEGAIVLPGAAYAELALAVAAGTLDGGTGYEGPFVIEDLAFERALILPEAGAVQIKVRFDPERAQLAVHAGGEGEPWKVHARAAIRAGTMAPCCLDLAGMRRRCDRLLPDPYARFRAAGLEYGPAFQGICELRSGEGEALSRVRPALGTTMGGFLPPDLLDAAFQTLLGALGRGADPQPAYLPVAIRRLRLLAPLGNAGTNELYVHARVTRQNASTIEGEIRLLDGTGLVLAEVTGFTGRRIGAAAAARAVPADHLYSFRWRVAARPDLASPVQALPSPGEIAARVRARQDEWIDAAERNHYYAIAEPALDLAAARIAAIAFAGLGQRLDPERPRTAAALLGTGDAAGAHQRLLRRLLAMLEATGVVRAGPDGFRLDKAFAGDEDIAAILDPLRREFPLYGPEIEILGCCGEALAPVIRGEAEPLAILFPEGSLALIERIYRRSRSFGLYHALAREALRELLDRLPATAILHILEIGGGTGSLTAEMLDLLAPGRTRYTFTDISPSFLQKATQQFAAHPFLDYRTLDLEQDPETQGFAPGTFHLVLAGDVLHATKDLGSSLDRVHRLLAPGGILLAPELTHPPYWFDLVFGLLPGWWLFADRELRPDHACISGEAWRRLLMKRGFAEVELLRDAEGPEETVHSVLLARAAAALSEEAPAPHGGEAPGTWLILGRTKDRVRQVEESLAARGQKTLAVGAGGDEAWEEILARAAADLRGVVLFGDQVPFGEEMTAADTLAVTTASCSLALCLMQRLAAAKEAYGASVPPRLFLVTAGAETILEGDRADPAQATIWGLGRVFLNEHPEIPCTLIDLAAAPAAGDLEALVKICLAPDEETEIALRAGALFVHRLERIAAEAMAPAILRPAAADEPLELGYSRSGALDNLRIQETERHPPGPGEVEVRTAAAGLNFRDIMKLLGIYPSEDEEPPILGDEAAGTIAALGPGIEDLAVGDRVVAIGPGFRRYFTLDRRLVARLPEGIDFAAGATLPIAFLTAQYALRHLGRIAPGESLLVHAGAGGVGQAALQIGRRAGARLFATAGSEIKRAFLRAQGIEHVFDSRSLDFADEILDVTEGRGVDIVLNSLSGQAIAKSLSLLRPYGRFLEIGKTDIYRDSAIGLKPFRRNLGYFAIDLDALFRQRPAQAGALLNEVMEEVRSGRIAPLEHRVFPLGQAAQAFRHMAQAKHIGKVVIDCTDPEIRVAPRPFAALPARAEGLYLITGGLGGLGRKLAGWLIGQGARHIALLGRRNLPDAAAAAEIERLRTRGAEVEILACDVADEAALGRTLKDLRRRGRPLLGVIHGAMVLDDGLIAQLDPARLERVLRPKIAGAVALHRLTLDDPLEFFVLFSSFAATVGNIGQGNYAAANAFLGALAHYRRSLGRPALAVDWGVIAAAGYVAEHAEIEQHFRRQGLSAFPPEQAFAALAAMLEQGATSLGLVAIDWAAWSRHAPAIAASPRFRSLVEDSSREAAQASGAKPVLERLKSAAATERPAILIHLMQEQLAAVLGLSSEQIDTRKAPNALGLDSLMAVEFGCLIEDRLGFKPGTLELIQAPSLAVLAERFIEKVAL